MNHRILPNRWMVRVIWGGTLGEEPQCIYTTAIVFKKLNLAPGNNVYLRIGNLQRPVRVLRLLSSSQSQAIIFLSPDLAGCCELTANQEITLKYDNPTNQLSIGPLIGLFTVRNILPDSEYGSQEPVLAALANSSADIGGHVFVFCPEDIDWDDLTVNGHIPCQKDNALSWSATKLPLPDVVYDRVPSRSIEARPEVSEAKLRLQGMMAWYFNPMFLDKWETHLALKSTPDVAQHLPPTRLVESPDDIKTFLDLYKTVFLKPTAGSLGRRIIKIKANPDGYSFVYRSKDKLTVQGTAPDFNKLLIQLKPVMGKRSYIVQKDLKLAQYQNCTFDIRVLAQKDMFGNWRRTKIYVRVAAPDSFLSNLSDGAKPHPMNTVLKEVFSTDFSDKEGLGENIRAAVRRIPPALEQATGMIWGELGIDLGIDTNGKIWLIEVNSKPFRTLVSNSGSTNLVRRSLLRPLEFAKFLAGFYGHSPATQNPQ